MRVGSASNQRSDGWQAKRKSVAIKDGKLSVNAQGRSLRSVLNEISRDACVAVTGAGSVDDSPVSVQFQDLPIDEGLRRILTHYDTFFFYRAGQSGPPMLAAIWIYPKGQAQGVVPVPPEEWAGTKELEAMRADPDPETRARAVQTLIERKPAQAAANILAESLRDQDDRVRTRALYSALSKGVRLAPESLADLALNDALPEIRFLALDALSTSPGARKLAQRVLKDDPDPHVRNRAEEILNELKATARPPRRNPKKSTLKDQEDD